MALLIFTIALSVYFVLHSLLATNGVKRAIVKALMPVRYYRVFYNLTALVLLLPLVWLFLSMKKQYLWDNDWLILPGGLLGIAGLVWAIKALRGYDMREFTGLYQLENGRPPASTALKVNGLNSQVRHPLYFGTLLILWAVFLIYPTDVSLVVAAVSSSYLFVGSKLEEQKLGQQFGESYRSYQREVPMLIPFKWRRKKI